MTREFDAAHRLTAVLLLGLAASACSDMTAPEIRRPATVVVSPAEAEVTSIGAPLAFTARVFDAQGRELEGVSLTWEAADTSVLAAAGDGRFRSIGTGRTAVRARVASGPPTVDRETYLSGQGVAGVSSVLVDQRPARIDITPADRKLWAVGEITRLSARVVDALGTPMLREPTIAWGTEEERVATVEQTGTVRAVADGTTRVIALIEGAPAAAATIEVSSTIPYRACAEYANRKDQPVQACAAVHMTAQAGR